MLLNKWVLLGPTNDITYSITNQPNIPKVHVLPDVGHVKSFVPHDTVGAGGKASAFPLGCVLRHRGPLFPPQGMWLSFQTTASSWCSSAVLSTSSLSAKRINGGLDRIPSLGKDSYCLWVSQASVVSWAVGSAGDALWLEVVSWLSWGGWLLSGTRASVL